MKIRKATNKDAKRIFELFSSSDNLLGYKGEKFTLEEIKDYIQEKIDRVRVFEIKGKVVGGFSAEFWRDYCYLAFFVVDKDYCHHGIGEKMLEYLEKIGRKEGYIGLLVKETNIPMKKLIKKRGYKGGDKFVYYHKNIK